MTTVKDDGAAPPPPAAEAPWVGVADGHLREGHTFWYSPAGGGRVTGPHVAEHLCRHADAGSPPGTFDRVRVGRLLYPPADCYTDPHEALRMARAWLAHLIERTPDVQEAARRLEAFAALLGSAPKEGPDGA
jgi:hypothetical protein